MAPSPRCGCLLCGSCSSGREFAYSFLPTTPHDDAVAVRLAVPAIRVRRGLPPPSHRLATTANQMALSRHAPCLAHHREGCSLLRAASASRPAGIGWSGCPAVGPSYWGRSVARRGLLCYMELDGKNGARGAVPRTPPFILLSISTSDTQAAIQHARRPLRRLCQTR